MGLEKLSPKEFRKYKDIIAFLNAFDITIEDLIELKQYKDQIKHANLTQKDNSHSELEKQRKLNEQEAQINAIKTPTPNEVINTLIASGEKEGFYPNGRNS